MKVEFNKAGEAAESITSDIVNFSREGIALDLRNEYLTEGSLVRLSVAPELQTRAAEYFRKELLGPTEGAFRVVHANDNALFIGLAAQA